MKKVMILGLILSIFAFGGNKDEVKKAYAAEATPVVETSATFFESSIYNKHAGTIDRYLSNDELNAYKDNIVSIKISNKAIDLPSAENRICDPIKINGCTYTDATGKSSIPEAGVIFAYISEAIDSSETNKRYDCVLYANVDKIYANQDANHMFYKFPAVEEIDLKLLDVSKTISLEYFFYYCGKLKNIDLSTMNTSNVQDMGSMFMSCSSLIQIDLSNFDFSNVIMTSLMFFGCTSLTELDLSNHNATNLIHMNDMFSKCSSLKKINLSNFKAPNAKTTNYMFNECSSLTELNLLNFDISSVETMRDMFYKCSSLTKLDLSNLDLSNVYDIYSMVNSCTSLKEINLSCFSNATNMSTMDNVFANCTSLTKLDVSYFKTSNVKQMRSIFYNCSALSEIVGLSNFETTSLRQASDIFNGCRALKMVDLSSFDLSNCNGYYDMLENCSSLEYIKSPKALPADSTTNSKHAITLPDQFSPYSGITSLTSGNLADHKVINLKGDRFIYEWKNLRTEGGDNGICAALTNGTEGNTKLTQLLADYKSFDAETKEYVDATIDKEDVTIGDSVEYFQNVIDGKQQISGNYNGIKDDAGSYMTMSLTEESPYLIALISLIGVLSVVSYYFYNKKKHAN